MSKNVIFELNYAGVRELLKSDAMQSILQEYANARLPGVGYYSKTFVMPTRAVARMSAGTQEAAQDNMTNNSLLKALGSH